MIWQLIGLVFFAGAIPEVAHDFHVSRTRVIYAAGQGELQVTMHVFIDDLEEALRLRGIEGLRLGTARESEAADEQLVAYLRDRFSLAVNEQAVEYSFVGKELSEDLQAFYIYLLVEDVAAPRRLWVRQRALMEVYDDQQNIVQLQGPEGRRGNFIFHRGYQQDTASFE